MPLWSMDEWQYVEREVLTDPNGRQWTVALMDVLGSRVIRTFRASRSSFSTHRADISRSSIPPAERYRENRATPHWQRRRTHTKTFAWPLSMAASIHHNPCSVARTSKIDETKKNIRSLFHTAPGLAAHYRPGFRSLITT